MQLIIKNYGRAILLCTVFFSLACLLFGGFIFKGKQGLLYAMGNTAALSLQENEKVSARNQYDAYLLQDKTDLRISKKLYAESDISVPDCFHANTKVLDVRVVDVLDCDTGESLSNAIRENGTHLFFEGRGMYRITISLLDEKNVSSKYFFYIYVN